MEWHFQGCSWDLSVIHTTSYKGKGVAAYLTATKDSMSIGNGEAGSDVWGILEVRWTCWREVAREWKAESKITVSWLDSSLQRHWEGKRLFFMRNDKVSFTQVEGKKPKAPVGNWKCGIKELSTDVNSKIHYEDQCHWRNEKNSTQETYALN